MFTALIFGENIWRSVCPILFFFSVSLLPDQSQVPNQTQLRLLHENNLVLAPPPSEEAAADSLFALKRLRLVNCTPVTQTGGQN